IECCFDGGIAMDVALAGYHRRRDEAARPIFELTCDMAAGPPKPDVLALLTAMTGNQAAIDRFFGGLAGTVADADFFSDDNIAAIFAAGANYAHSLGSRT